MTLHKMAVSAGLTVGLAMASLGIAAAAGTAAASASTRVTNVGFAGSRAAQPVSSQDRMFMDQASQINLTEISLGRYIARHATITSARNLGATYARDHTAAQANLRALASRLHVTLPTTPNVQNRSMVGRIEAQKGTSKDLAFASASVTGHEAAIAVFRKEDSAGSNPAVKAYAANYLPMLERHLKLAKHEESVIRAMPAK
jgi:putative membrane protein